MFFKTVLLFLFVSVSCLHAGTTLYKSLADPLYTSLKHFEKLQNIDALKVDIVAFATAVKMTKKRGDEARISQTSALKKNYLQELRVLQKHYNRLLHLLQKEIDRAIKKDDYTLFLKLTAYEFNGLLENSNEKNRATLFYEKHKASKKCQILEKKIHECTLIDATAELFQAEIIKSSYNSHTKTKSKKKVTIRIKRVANEIQVAFVNKNIYPITIRVKAEYKNLKPLQKPLDEFVIPAKKSLHYATLKVLNGGSYYSYSWNWIMGSKKAKHDDSYVYSLPYKKGTSHLVSQGYNGSKTHKGSSAYSIDFVMPEGTKVYAAREGLVVKTKSNSDVGGYDRKYASSGNYVRVMHSDGTFATYYHLKYRGVLVKAGQRVEKGEPLGYSGNTGYTSGPHLHFSVFKVTSASKRETVATKILTSEGVISEPVVRHYYKSK